MKKRLLQITTPWAHLGDQNWPGPNYGLTSLSWVLWKGAGGIPWVRCPVPLKLLNVQQERSVVFYNWVYHMSVCRRGESVLWLAAPSIRHPASKENDDECLMIWPTIQNDPLWVCINKIVKKRLYVWYESIMQHRHGGIRHWYHPQYRKHVVMATRLSVLPGSSNLFRRKNFSLFCFFFCVWRLSIRRFTRKLNRSICRINGLFDKEKVVRSKISLPTSDLQNHQCKVQEWFVTHKSSAKIFKAKTTSIIHSV